MSHGHDHTVSHAIDALKAHCEKIGARCTPPREAVLGAIVAAGKPVGAYDIMADLEEALDSPKPPTIYRAIEFLMAQHFIHRIESLNAYVVCDIDHRHSGAQFMICDGCMQVFETHQCHLPTSLEKQAEDMGFTPEHWISEVHGTCAECATQAA